MIIFLYEVSKSPANWSDSAGQVFRFDLLLNSPGRLELKKCSRLPGLAWPRHTISKSLKYAERGEVRVVRWGDTRLDSQWTGTLRCLTIKGDTVLCSSELSSLNFWKQTRNIICYMQLFLGGRLVACSLHNMKIPDEWTLKICTNNSIKGQESETRIWNFPLDEIWRLSSPDNLSEEW